MNGYFDRLWNHQTQTITQLFCFLEASQGREKNEIVIMIFLWNVVGLYVSERRSEGFWMERTTYYLVPKQPI